MLHYKAGTVIECCTFLDDYYIFMIQINKVRLVMHLILFGMHCGMQCNSACRKVQVCHCNSLGGAT